MQESNIGSQALELAKDLAKAEKELKVEIYVRICIVTKAESGEEIILKQYDIRRNDVQRWSWVIAWREARLICENPRRHIYRTFSYYDKRSGMDYGIRSDLSKLSSYKALITKQERLCQQYIENKRGDMFFDESTDEQLIKIKAKLERAKEKVRQAEMRLEQKVEQIKQSQPCTKTL